MRRKLLGQGKADTQRANKAHLSLSLPPGPVSGAQSPFLYVRLINWVSVTYKVHCCQSQGKVELWSLDASLEDGSFLKATTRKACEVSQRADSPCERPGKRATVPTLRRLTHSLCINQEMFQRSKFIKQMEISKKGASHVWVCCPHIGWWSEALNKPHLLLGHHSLTTGARHRYGQWLQNLRVTN